MRPYPPPSSKDLGRHVRGRIRRRVKPTRMEFTTARASGSTTPSTATFAREHAPASRRPLKKNSRPGDARDYPVVCQLELRGTTTLPPPRSGTWRRKHSAMRCQSTRILPLAERQWSLLGGVSLLDYPLRRDNA